MLGGDFNVAPEDSTCGILAPATVEPTFRSASGRPSTAFSWGLVDAYRFAHSEPERYTWWDYRAGNFHKNFGMRIDHLLISAPLKPRVVWAEIDREARKGNLCPQTTRLSWSILIRRAIPSMPDGARRTSESPGACQSLDRPDLFRASALF